MEIGDAITLVSKSLENGNYGPEFQEALRLSDNYGPREIVSAFERGKCAAPADLVASLLAMKEERLHGAFAAVLDICVGGRSGVPGLRENVLFMLLQTSSDDWVRSYIFQNSSTIAAQLAKSGTTAEVFEYGSRVLMETLRTSKGVAGIPLPSSFIRKTAAFWLRPMFWIDREVPAEQIDSLLVPILTMTAGRYENANILAEMSSNQKEGGLLFLAVSPKTPASQKRQACRLIGEGLLRAKSLSAGTLLAVAVVDGLSCAMDNARLEALEGRRGAEEWVRDLGILRGISKLAKEGQFPSGKEKIRDAASDAADVVWDLLFTDVAVEKRADLLCLLRKAEIVPQNVFQREMGKFMDPKMQTFESRTKVATLVREHSLLEDCDLSAFYVEEADQRVKAAAVSSKPEIPENGVIDVQNVDSGFEAAADAVAVDAQEEHKKALVSAGRWVGQLVDSFRNIQGVCAEHVVQAERNTMTVPESVVSSTGDENRPPAELRAFHQIRIGMTQEACTAATPHCVRVLITEEGEARFQVGDSNELLGRGDAMVATAGALTDILTAQRSAAENLESPGASMQEEEAAMEMGM